MGAGTMTQRRQRWQRWLLAGALALACMALATNAPFAGTPAEDEAAKPAPDSKAPKPAEAQDPPPPPAAPAPASGTAAAPPEAPAAAPGPEAAAAPVAAPTPPEAPAGEAAPAPAAATETPPAAPPAPTVVTIKEGNIVELHVKNQDLATVLELLARECKLNIVASKKATGRVSADLYRATLDEVMAAVCRANGLKWVREGNFIYVHTPDELVALNEDEARMKTEVFTLNYVTSADAQKAIAPALSKKATVATTSPAEVGIASSATVAGGNKYGLQDMLLVRDFPENLENARAILKKIDGRPRQVLVEATILAVTLSDANSLGINFNALAGVDFRDLSNTVHPITNPTTVPSNPATTVDVTTQNANAPWAQVRTSGFAVDGPGLNVGVITHNISLFVHALEEISDTIVLGNPKVLALNKQRAEVIVGERIGYRTSTVTETTTVQNVEFLDTGTQLIFRPFISDDGYVRMEIHPKVSTGQLVNELPREQTTEVTCNVMVKNGNTIVIGGLFDETAGVSNTQIPGLGNIPLLGWMFRVRTESSVRREIIILLTPRIIEEEEAYATGAQMAEDAKRRCLGLREGFALYSRDRLTMLHMQEAGNAWQRYEKSSNWCDLVFAWWNTELALNIAPNNLKAMRLKDKIFTASHHGRPAPLKTWTLWDSIDDRMKTWASTPKPAPEGAPAAPPDGQAGPAKAEPPPAASAAPPPEAKAPEPAPAQAPAPEEKKS